MSKIWFDLVTPKSILFFKPMILNLQNRGLEVLITTRGGEGYKETIELLKLHNLEFVNIGNFGGSCLLSKFKASLDRQFHFMEFIANENIDRLVCLSSVDASRVAFGLGIPIMNFYDIPLSDCKEDFKKALPQARLTIPLASKMFKPFVVPDEIFLRFSLEKEQIFDYKFIDPLIWLKDFKPNFEYVKKIYLQYNIDVNKPTIIIREEEYKSSYVDKKYPFLYNALEEIQQKSRANIIIIPRYESEYLKKEFPFAYVIEEKIEVQHLLAFANLFIGGGGTLNSEACFLGTPTISTRSFISHYDKYQIDKGVMVWINDKDELIKKSLEMLNMRNNEKLDNFLSEMEVDIEKLCNSILA